MNALAPTPGAPDPRLERALAFHRAGAVGEAAALYEAVLESRPDDVDALHLLGVARRAQGRRHEAAELVRRALRLAPGLADTWYNLGNIETDLGNEAAAAEAFERAVGLRPSEATFWFALGCARARLGCAERAIDAYRRALAVDPEHLAARHNLANQLFELGDDRAAASELRAVAERAPDLAEAHYNLARALLRSGDYTTGFAEYVWRWRVAAFPDRERWPELPVWQGEPLSGRTLLVQAEQGYGDTIQFVRLLPMVASLGPRVRLEVPARLVRLLSGVDGAEAVLPIGPSPPEADLRIPLLDLPHRLGLTLGSIPRAVPYLRAESARIRQWRERLGRDGRLLVAMCWRGNPAAPIDRGRSLPSPEPLAAALDHPAVRRLALTEPGVHPLEPIEGGSGWKLAGVEPTVEHPGPELDAGPDGFVDSAALLELADLVVTTDTAIAHLAGALARPTWLLLPRSADWRWLRERTDSPWYPTMRLFRQTTAGDWEAPLAAVASALDQLRAERQVLKG
ncbi:MAG: hypothetical protein KatS3mg117_0426 [Geminicoccaceae bacterium]|nr:MAG: hypothetical protein KatS3mg117_0426 [Geminicoccaceae bacterium]